MCNCPESEPNENEKWLLSKMAEKMPPDEVNSLSAEADLRYLAQFATTREIDRLFEEVTRDA